MEQRSLADCTACVSLRIQLGVRQVDGSSHHVALNNGGRQVAAHGFHLIDFYEKGIGGGGL